MSTAAPRSRRGLVREFGPLFELGRALNPYSLSVGACAAAALGTVAYVSLRTYRLPFAVGGVVVGLLVALAAFVVITALHVALHVYFGRRFAQGISAAHTGHSQRAARLLAPRTWSGMDHYDLHGHAHRALLVARGAGAR